MIGQELIKMMEQQEYAWKELKLIFLMFLIVIRLIIMENKLFY